MAAAAAVDSLDTSDVFRARLRLAVCGAAEMAGFLSRWDRYYPKAFEATANHRFAALGFSCETNLLAELGRGTIRRRLAASVAAARWASAELKIGNQTVVRPATGRRQRLAAGSLLSWGSSERQAAADGSIDLVVTDPPYFDDVQYGELASLFLVWAQSLELVPTSVSLDLGSEAVPNSVRGVGVDEYQGLLRRIFRETRRTLKPSGRLIITFHNTDIRAWWALARALKFSGFAVIALAVADAENGKDHPKRNRHSFTKDLVLECSPKPATHRSRLAIKGTDAQERELYAAGRAVAAGGAFDIRTFSDLFLKERGLLRRPRIEVTKRHDP